MRDFIIAYRQKLLTELFVSENACLRQSVNCSAYFQVHKSSFRLRIQIILFYIVQGGTFKSIHMYLYLSSGDPR